MLMALVEEALKARLALLPSERRAPRPPADLIRDAYLAAMALEHPLEAQRRSRTSRKAVSTGEEGDFGSDE